LPANGSRPTMTAMLMSASIMIQKERPPASNLPSRSGALAAIFRPRHRMTAY
jgi:hypothetical protein